MFFRNRGGAAQEIRQEKKRTKVIRFLDEIFKSHDLSNILLEYLKSHLRQLPPDVKNALKDVLGVETTRNEAPLAKPKIIPEPPREYTFQEIDDLIFDRIKTIVSQASPDERFPQGFSNHLLDPNDPEKGMLDAKIRGLQYNSVVNFILRIDQELNKNFEWSETFINENQPTAEAARAIRGLINSLIEIREGKIVPKSQNKEVYNFIVSCSQKKILGIFDQCLLLEHQDDQEYYSMFVGNALDCLREEHRTSWWPGRTGGHVNG